MKIDLEQRQKEIGALIRKERLEHGWSKNEFGHIIGYEQQRCDSYVDSFETGKRPVPLEKIRAIKTALGLRWEDLIP